MATTTTTHTGTGATVRVAAPSDYVPNAFAEAIEEIPVERVDTARIVDFTEEDLVETPEGGLKPVVGKVGSVQITPTKGAHVEVHTEEALIAMSQPGEDAVEALDRITRSRAKNKAARFSERVTVARLNAKANAASTTSIATAEEFFDVRGAVISSVESSGKKVLALSKGFADQLLGVDATDGRARIRSLDEIAGVDHVIVFKGSEAVAYVFDATKVKAAVYSAFDKIKIIDSVVELEDGTVRGLAQHNEYAGITEYSYGVGVLGDAGSVAKIELTEAAG